MTDITNDNYVVKASSVFFTEATEAKWVGRLIKGKADALISISAGNSGNSIKQQLKLFSFEGEKFTGLEYLNNHNKYLYSYRAADNIEIALYEPGSGSSSSASILAKKENIALAINSLASMVELSWSAYKKLQKIADSLADLAGAMALYLCHIKDRAGTAFSFSGEIFLKAEVELLKLKNSGSILSSKFNEDTCKRGQYSRNQFFTGNHHHLDESKVAYYSHLQKIPQELCRYFFSYDPYILDYHIKDATALLTAIKQGSISAACAIVSALECLYSGTPAAILTQYDETSKIIKAGSDEAELLLEAVEKVNARVRETLSFLRSDFEYDPGNTPDRMDSYINILKARLNTSQSQPSGSNLSVTGCSPLEELTDSTVRILEYANTPKEQVRPFLAALEGYKCLDDKFSPGADARAIRKKIQSTFFDIYTEASKRAMSEPAIPRLIKMFLNFGYMDEKLLQKDQTISLYKLADEFISSPVNQVYNIQQWLSDIYNKQRSPSVNEFGQDYSDVFRELKKQGSVSEKEKQEYDNNLNGRLEFEIKNMFQTNQKLCYGQISTYFPILHSDMITRDLESTLITPKKITDSINRILEVDFSAFHREVSYRNPEYSIEKEFVMKAVQPDIILVPTFGSRAIMWQEIADRNRRMPGRFIFPVFTAENLDDLMIRVIGNYRWELCRTMMGTAWNDITQKSLTSEYTDYIQFFKKNSDLHEEVKEKIRVQIQKFRGMMRDIFTADYDVWINYESKGMLRLNKQSRSILYRYCPFNREIRSQLEKQPAYSEAALQLNAQRLKQAKELENRYGRLVKAGIPLDDELKDNLEYFKDK